MADRDDTVRDMEKALEDILEMLRIHAPGTTLNNHQFDELGIQAYAALSAHKAAGDGWRSMEYADIDTTMWIGVDALNVPDISTLHVDQRDCQMLIDNITYPKGEVFEPRRCTLLIHKADAEDVPLPSPPAGEKK